MDLGLRVRELLFRREVVVGATRRSLAGQLGSAWGQPGRVARNQGLIEPFLHTWPLGALIEGARERWRRGPDGEALAVLSRCAEIVGTSVGWPSSVDRRWPMPDAGWMRAQVPEGAVPEVVSRGPMDGSVAVAVALGVPRSGHAPIALPPYRTVPGDEAAARREELLGALDAGDIAAVRWTGHLPHDEASRAAFEAIRGRAPAQAAFDRYGLAGLVAGGAPAFEELLGRAPAGVAGERPTPRCDAVVVPTLSKDGRVERVGCIVWDAPYAPVLVVPAAVEILRRLDGEATAADIARELELSEATVRRVLMQLAEVGATSAA